MSALRPACAHSECAQSWIDTGDPRCVAGGDPAFRLPPDLVGTALAIRAALPHLPLSDALTYADASAVQGKAFRSRSGFCGLGCSRDAFAFALAWYAVLWGPIDNPRLARLSRAFRVRLGPCARLESADPEVRRAYGAIVRSEHAAIVAWERFARRAKRRGLPVPAWPGTRNMRPHAGGTEATIRAWFASEGFDPEAIAAFAPRSRGEAFEHMRAMLAPIPIVNVNASEVQS